MSRSDITEITVDDEVFNVRRSVLESKASFFKYPGLADVVKRPDGSMTITEIDANTFTHSVDRLDSGNYTGPIYVPHVKLFAFSRNYRIGGLDDCAIDNLRKAMSEGGITAADVVELVGEMNKLWTVGNAMAADQLFKVVGIAVADKLMDVQGEAAFMGLLEQGGRFVPHLVTALGNRLG